MSRWLALLCTPLLASCLIAESPAEFPEQPVERPTILQSRVIPTASRVLASMPVADFVVPVKLLNPRQVFYWRVFVDFDPRSQDKDRAEAGGESGPNNEDLQPNDALNGIRRIAFRLTPLDQALCHTIEFIASAQPFPGNDPRLIHSVDPLQSDQITWFYSPGGDLAGCPVQDAPVPPYDDPPLTNEDSVAE